MGYDEEMEARKIAYHDVKNADKLGETEFSELFHEARTAASHYSTATVPVRYNEDGTYEVGEVVKTRKGEHFKANDSWDGVVSIPTKSFMDTHTARSLIKREIQGPFSF